jgi:23S rRNA (pseudouridine1915-N3)-methyltransferase
VRVIIAAVGRPKDRALAAAIHDYEARAGHYWPIEVVEVKGERGDGDPASVLTVRSREAARLTRRIGTVGTLVACDATGTTFTSEQFAEWLQAEREGARDVAFAIGGAFGLADEIRDAATMTLSMASWTLPHELARLVLAEQLYRAGTIVRREPYHK